MDGQQLLEVLLVLPDQVERRELLAAQIPNLSPKQQDRLAEALKAQADQLIQSEISRCLEFADLIHELADLSGIQRYRALGLLAQANAYVIGLGEYQKGMALYDEAAAIYGELDCPEKQAQSQTGKLWALANLGRYEEALATGEWVAEVLEEHGAWLALAKLTSNVAIILGRLGRESEALDSLDMARNSYRKLGSEGEINLLRVEINRAITLRNLGRFDESIATNKSVLESYGRLGFDQSIAVARAQQNLGITYFVLGRYNEALALLDKAQETFAADGRQRHAMLVELFVSDCLLQLSRNTREVRSGAGPLWRNWRPVGSGSRHA
jgi:tetratricopeptide (TPR) repeat protein